MPAKKIKILFVSHTDQLNGAERSLLTLVKLLRELGKIEPIVLVPGKNGPLITELQNNKITTVQANYYHWDGRSFFNNIFKGPIRLVSNLVQVFRLRNTMQELGLDVVYSNTIVNPFGAMLAFSLSLPSVWHVREFIHEDMGRTFDIGTNLAAFLINKAEMIICNSYAIHAKWKNYLDGHKLVVIYNGFCFSSIDKEEGQKYQRCVKNARPITLVFIGSITPHKGQIDAINALSVLLKKGLDVQLKIVGSGENDYLIELKQLCRELGIEKRIHWEGYVGNTNKIYQQAALTLICSRCEAFGRVAVESMSNGTPVVASDTGGLPEIVQDGITGSLYKFGEYRLLAAQIETLLADEHLYQTFSIKGRQSVLKRFNEQQYVSQIETLLLTVASKKSNRKELLFENKL